jgi:hypothetical protein
MGEGGDQKEGREEKIGLTEKEEEEGKEGKEVKGEKKKMEENGKKKIMKEEEKGKEKKKDFVLFSPLFISFYFFLSIPSL